VWWRRERRTWSVIGETKVSCALLSLTQLLAYIHAVMQSCSHAAMQSCSHAVMLSCSHAVMQSCSHAVMLPCTHMFRVHSGTHSFIHTW
jgi:hypothetical protein